MAIELQPGETELGNWTVYYERPGQRQLTGKLIVTSQRVLFEAQMDASRARGVAQLLNSHWRDARSFAVDRAEVTCVEARKSFLAKRVQLTFTDGSTHVFNRGMMSIDQIMSALQG